MVQPKYSPEEALDKIKLMMKYDSSKTLNENKGIVSEQKSNENIQSPNTLTDNDLLGDTGKIRQIFQGLSQFFGPSTVFDTLGVNFADIIASRRIGVKGVVDALDGFVNIEDLTYILGVIKSLNGKCYYDSVENKTVPAIIRFIELYKEDENEELVDEINNVGTRTLSTGADKIKQTIIKEIETQQTNSCGSSTKTDGTKTDGSSQTESYKPCSGSYSYGCKSEAIKTVQSCLGLTPDGKFGPKTKEALKTKGFTSFTDTEVDKICGKQPQVEPEITGVEDVVNPIEQ